MTDAYEIHLPVFEGPFDLLLHLIREKQVDIYDIPIAEITEDYLAYLDKMKEMDLEIASSFLVMAATLLAIKSRMLLPKPIDDAEEEETDARSELVQELLEYMRFKEAAQNMSALAEQRQMNVSRPNEETLYLNLFSAENPLTGKTLADLQNAFSLVLKKAEERGMVMHIEREQVTLQGRLDHLFELLKAKPEGMTFSAAFADCHSKMALIVTFLALLELIRLGAAHISQSDAYEEIYLYAGDLGKYEC